MGEKFELLLYSVITTAVVTKRHFDNYRGQELRVASHGDYIEQGALIMINPPTDMFLQCFTLAGRRKDRQKPGTFDGFS